MKQSLFLLKLRNYNLLKNLSSILHQSCMFIIIILRTYLRRRHFWLQTDLHHTNIFSFPAKNTGGSWIENHRHTQCSSKDQRKTSLYSAVRSVLCPLSLTVITRSSQIVLKLVTSNTWWIETVSCTLRKVTMTTGTRSCSRVRTLLTMS